MRYLPLLLVLSFLLRGTSLHAGGGLDDDSDVTGSSAVPEESAVSKEDPAPVVATVPDDDDASPEEPRETTPAKSGLQSGSQPPSTAARDRREVERLDQAGDREAARKYALEALKRNPDDKDLKAFAELTAPAKAGVDSKTVKSRIAELMTGMRKEEEPGAGAIMASPISFGALTGARAPAAAAPPIPPGAASAEAARVVSPLTRAAATKLQLRDLAGADSLLSRRLDENPGDSTALRLRALARREMKNYDSSAEDARGALMIMPMDMRALRILVEDLVDLGRREEALRLADQAIKAYPGDPHALVARAAVWKSMDRPDLQLSDLKEAAALDAQFDSLVAAAQPKAAAPAPAPYRPRSVVLWLALIGTALLFISFPLFPKVWSRGHSEIRAADRAAAATPRPDAVPTGYTLGEQLGRGGMGVVYAGEDRALKRKVAIKILRPEVAESPRERQRFLKEARTVAKLKHPNIVDIHSVHDENGAVWLVFEHIQGETLHELLGRGRLSSAKALGLLGQVAAALDYAHGQGVIHQDLKPGNIMTAGEVAKVMDFGIARCVRETLSTMSRLEVAGTPAYMAPEQELGGTAAAPAADIFAFGACAYECLSGQMPFPGGYVMIKMEKRYRPLSELAGLPPAVDPVIARALDPEPAKRWPTASAFVAALAQALQESPAVQRAGV